MWAPRIACIRNGGAGRTDEEEALFVRSTVDPCVVLAQRGYSKAAEIPDLEASTVSLVAWASAVFSFIPRLDVTSGILCCGRAGGLEVDLDHFSVGFRARESTAAACGFQSCWLSLP